MHSSLLLFLKQLRCIVIRDKRGRGAAAHRVMQRVDCGMIPQQSCAAVGGSRVPSCVGKIVCIHETETHEKGLTLAKKQQEWLLVTKHLVPTIPRGKKTISGTQVCVAIPLLNDTESDAAQRDVFAYLPLRGYGLRYVVQADFIVPSSREAIDASQAWNQWLKHEADALFVEACALMADMGRRALDGLSDASACVCVCVCVLCCVCALFYVCTHIQYAHRQVCVPELRR